MTAEVVNRWGARVYRLDGLQASTVGGAVAGRIPVPVAVLNDVLERGRRRGRACGEKQRVADPRGVVVVLVIVDERQRPAGDEFTRFWGFTGRSTGRFRVPYARRQPYRQSVLTR